MSGKLAGMSQTLSIAAREKRLLKALHAQPALLACVEGLVELTQTQGASPLPTADEIEEKVVERVRHLGREVIGGWAQRAEARVAAEVRGGHPQARLREKRPRWRTTFGPVALRESVWRLPGQARHYHRPFAARVGVSARGCSRRLARAAAEFGCEQSFARAGERLFEITGCA